MALRLEQKQEIAEQVGVAVRQASSAVLADYRRLTVDEMTLLRAKARDSGVYLKVVRNTLARRAVAGTDHECLSEAFVGPTLLALSQDEPGAGARILRDFGKDNAFLKVKALSVGGALLEADQLDRVAALPTRREALSLLVAVVQAPVAKLVRTLNAVPSKLVRTLAAVRDAKAEQQGARET